MFKLNFWTKEVMEFGNIGKTLCFLLRTISPLQRFNLLLTKSSRQNISVVVL